MLWTFFYFETDKTLPYLPVYNARPCIICTLIFDHVILKKRFQGKHQELKLPCFHLINKSWEFINDMFTCLLTYLLKLQISHAPSTYLHAFLFNKSQTFYKSCNLKSLLPSILKFLTKQWNPCIIRIVNLKVDFREKKCALYTGKYGM